MPRVVPELAACAAHKLATGCNRGDVTCATVMSDLNAVFFQEWTNRKTVSEAMTEYGCSQAAPGVDVNSTIVVVCPSFLSGQSLIIQKDSLLKFAKGGCMPWDDEGVELDADGKFLLIELDLRDSLFAKTVRVSRGASVVVLIDHTDMPIDKLLDAKARALKNGEVKFGSEGHVTCALARIHFIRIDCLLACGTRVVG